MLLDHKRHVCLKSSPVARTLHSLRLIRQVMQQEGFQMPETTLVHELAEVGNFNWRLFQPLVEGGLLDWESATIVVDAKLTNPEGIKFGQYFNEDRLHKLPNEVWASLPPTYAVAALSFEKASSLKVRAFAAFQSVMDDIGFSQSVVVTHDACAGLLVEAFTKGKKASLDPGTFIVLERRHDRTVITQVGDEIAQPGDEVTIF